MAKFINLPTAYDEFKNIFGEELSKFLLIEDDWPKVNVSKHLALPVQ